MLKYIALISLLAPLAACSTQTDADPFVMTAEELALIADGMVLVNIPEQDPGPPLYARATPILNQFFVTGDQLVIPFFRATSCIPPDFSIIGHFDFPTGPNSPGAFGCDLRVWGRLIIEPGSPLGTFPKLVNVWGASGMEIWVVSWSQFQTAMQTGAVTIEDLEAMNPLKGTASWFHERLKPRAEEHLVVIDASGQMADGRRFSFHVTHIGDETQSISLTIN
jgi:hypothetical protein